MHPHEYERENVLGAVTYPDTAMLVLLNATPHALPHHMVPRFHLTHRAYVQTLLQR